MELFNYLLKASACTVLFFAFYLLVLKKLTFFKLNRFYLLATLILSFLIPALNITVERQVAQALPIAEEVATFDQTPQTEAMPTEFTALQTSPATPSFDWFSLSPYLYAGIVLILLGIGFWQLISLLWHARSNQKTAYGLKLVVKRSGFTNCSFFNYVFVDQERLTEQELAVLLRHEQVHAQQYHSIDKIIMMLAKAVMWFNPVVYLWEKALEQVHEFEADEATSAHFGSKEYASLLLRLAVSKSNTPLIHNFVKSPIKERIKMLFNSKSSKMKKLMYTLVVPIVLGLIWGFTVKVVEVVAPEPVVISASEDPIIGRTIKGKIDSISGEGFWKIIYLKVGNKVYPIKNDIESKIKEGDELAVVIGGRTDKIRVFDKLRKEELVYDTPVYLMKQAISSTGEVLIKVPEQHAFLFEANQVRFATSKIVKLTRNSVGYISKLELNDGKFKILIDVVELKTKAENFKVGDAVTVKFIGEKLVANDVYATNKLIALYSNPKKHQIINPVLYNKFYTKQGYQLIRGGKPKPLIKTNLDTGVRLVSASQARGNISSGVTYFKEAKFKILTIILEGKEVTMDNKRGEIIAKNAKVFWADGKVKSAETIIYDIKKKTFTYYDFVSLEEKKNIISGPGKEGNLELLQNVSPSYFPYYASDSTVVSRIFGWQKLYGNANLTVEKYKLMGKSIHILSKEKMITIFDGSLKDDKDLKVEADIIEIDLAKKTYITKSRFD
ncbi:M56 family metallopeptidase [Pedobacter helvus]|uniref:M56 family metallopeptidase n=1 Tax=Pedobacter helvus TaxID=2563444 RepID=A0ABW9JPF0_9SPHI|nr:M56 family metallopeptidase [Pedobacter ureilyticus]